MTHRPDQDMRASYYGRMSITCPVVHYGHVCAISAFLSNMIWPIGVPDDGPMYCFSVLFRCAEILFHAGDVHARLSGPLLGRLLPYSPIQVLSTTFSSLRTSSSCDAAAGSHVHIAKSNRNTLAKCTMPSIRCRISKSMGKMLDWKRPLLIKLSGPMSSEERTRIIVYYSRGFVSGVASLSVNMLLMKRETSCSV